MATAAEQLVVDASVATKWHLPDEADADLAIALLTHHLTGTVQLVAPAHIRSEVPSAITVATRAILQGQQHPRRTVAQAAQAIADFLAIGLPTLDDDELVVAAYGVTQQYGCAFYDGLYLALAQRLGVRFILADRRFYTLIRHLPFVVWLADYETAASDEEDSGQR
jgi:predicted nucleic acid-binding protein